jgi:RNA polymerase sigma-70 factor, ECF subfamily
VLKERLPTHRRDWAAGSPASGAGAAAAAGSGSAEDGRALLRRYIDAFEEADPDALARLLREDVLLTMPPLPLWWHGREALMSSFSEQVLGFGAEAIRVRAAMLNRQPAAAIYLRKPGDSVHRAQGLNVLRVEDGTVAEITAFFPDRFPSLGLPMML